MLIRKPSTLRSFRKNLGLLSIDIAKALNVTPNIVFTLEDFDNHYYPKAYQLAQEYRFLLLEYASGNTDVVPKRDETLLRICEALEISCDNVLAVLRSTGTKKSNTTLVYILYDAYPEKLSPFEFGVLMDYFRETKLKRIFGCNYKGGK